MREMPRQRGELVQDWALPVPHLWPALPLQSTPLRHDCGGLHSSSIPCVVLQIRMGSPRLIFQEKLLFLKNFIPLLLKFYPWKGDFLALRQTRVQIQLTKNNTRLERLLNPARPPDKVHSTPPARLPPLSQRRIERNFCSLFRSSPEVQISSAPETQTRDDCPCERQTYRFS